MMTAPTLTPDQLALLRRIERHELTGQWLALSDITKDSDEERASFELRNLHYVCWPFNHFIWLIHAGRAALAEVEEK